MRWLLTITFAAVASVSVLTLVWAQGNGEGSATKDSGRREAAKEQGGDRSSDKNRDSERKLKEEMEREDSRATSRLYGKTVRASVRDIAALPAENLSSLNSFRHKEQLANLQPSPGLVQVVQLFLQRFSLGNRPAAAASRR